MFYSSLPYIITPFPPLFPPSPFPFNHPPLKLLFLTCNSHLSPLPLTFPLLLNYSSYFRLSPLQELASIRRREQLVREAVVGKSPGVYSQLFKRFIISSMHSTSHQCLILSGHFQLGQIGLICALVLIVF